MVGKKLLVEQQKNYFPPRTSKPKRNDWRAIRVSDPVFNFIASKGCVGMTFGQTLAELLGIDEDGRPLMKKTNIVVATEETS